jgi:hypothetical protein
MEMYFIWLSLTIGFVFTIFALIDIKRELKLRNGLLEEQNEILKKERNDIKKANEQEGYIKGYIQCQEDNKDKKYTEQDLRKAIELARETESVRRGALSEDWDDIEKYDEMDIIYLLNKQD